jgi:hypothetical protein
MVQVQGDEPHVELGHVEVPLPPVAGKREEFAERGCLDVVNRLGRRLRPSRPDLPVVISQDRHERRAAEQFGIPVDQVCVGLRTVGRGCEEMGLAPSGNGENPGKSAVAKVPVPIFSQPRGIGSVGKRDRCLFAEPKSHLAPTTFREDPSVQNGRLPRDSSPALRTPPAEQMHGDLLRRSGRVRFQAVRCAAASRHIKVAMTTIASPLRSTAPTLVATRIRLARRFGVTVRAPGICVKLAPDTGRAANPTARVPGVRIPTLPQNSRLAIRLLRIPHLFMRMRTPAAMAKTDRIGPAWGKWAPSKGSNPVAINQIASSRVPQPFVLRHSISRFLVL